MGKIPIKKRCDHCSDMVRKLRGYKAFFLCWRCYRSAIIPLREPIKFENCTHCNQELIYGEGEWGWEENKPVCSKCFKITEFD